MNSKKKLIIDKYTQPIFPPYDLYVLKNSTPEDIKELFIWDDGQNVEDSETLYGQGVTYSIMMKKDDPNQRLCIVVQIFTENFETDKHSDIDVISHEANHATFRILDYCNIKLTNDTTEVYAFLQGWITKCIYTTIKKKSNE